MTEPVRLTDGPSITYECGHVEDYPYPPPGELVGCLRTCEECDELVRVIATCSGALVREQRNKRPHLLRTAERLVTEDRNTTYDDPAVDFRRIAGLWSVYLDQDIEPHDVGALMALLKIARIRGNPAHADSWLDLAGYAACGYDCSPAEIGDAE